MLIFATPMVAAESTDEPAPEPTSAGPTVAATPMAAPEPTVAEWLASMPNPTCSTYTTTRLGTRGQPARCVETRLRQYGYWLSGPDDNFDSTAVNALRIFQQRIGVSATGVANRSLLQTMQIWRDPPRVPAPTCRTWLTVRLGSINDPANCVESRLTQYGYWLVGPDNRFDQTAVNALRIFQQRMGLAPTGVADGATLSALGIRRGAPQIPDTVCKTHWPVYAGDVGYPARCVETRLAQYGYWLSGPDGRFDSTAVHALRLFQAREGLEVTGWTDFPTLMRLQLWESNPYPDALCDVHWTLEPGDTGQDVRCLEGRLIELGYWVVGPDGYFDSSVRTALRNFQYRNGLWADAVAGPHTLSRLGIYDPTPDYGAPPPNSGSGRRIVYSRSMMTFWAIDEDGDVVKTHRVSGKSNEPYAGTYHVYSRSLYTSAVNNPSVRWRYMVRFAYGDQGGRIGFHEIPNRNGVPLQTREQLGLPLSAGCVRQSTSDAQWVWNWAHIGTKVVVL